MTNCVDEMSIDTFLKCWLLLKWSESKWTYCKSEPSFWPGTCPDAGVARNSRYHTAQAAMPRMSPGVFIILYFVKQTNKRLLSFIIILFEILPCRQPGLLVDRAERGFQSGRRLSAQSGWLALPSSCPQSPRQRSWSPRGTWTRPTRPRWMYNLQKHCLFQQS